MRTTPLDRFLKISLETKTIPACYDLSDYDKNAFASNNKDDIDFAKSVCRQCGLKDLCLSMSKEMADFIDSPTHIVLGGRDIKPHYSKTKINALQAISEDMNLDDYERSVWSSHYRVKPFNIRLKNSHLSGASLSNVKWI